MTELMGRVTRLARLSLLAWAALLASGCPRATPSTGAVVVVESGGHSQAVEVEVADDDAKRQRGLMYRKELAEDRGMIFVFEDESPHAFWMKDTLIPLDMIFIDGQQRVSGIVTRAQPLSLERRMGGVSRYVLEVAGGWAARHGVRAGDRVRIEGLAPRARP